MKCCSKIKGIYREQLDLKNKSGEKTCPWSYFEINSQIKVIDLIEFILRLPTFLLQAIHDTFLKENV